MSHIDYHYYQSDQLTITPVNSNKFSILYNGNPFILKGCKITTDRGIQALKFKSGMEFMISCPLDSRNPDHLRFFYMINRFHQDTWDYIQTKDPSCKYLDPIIKLIEGRYVILLPLKNKDLDQTIFIDQNNKLCPWHELEQITMTFIPILHFKKMDLKDDQIRYGISFERAELIEISNNK